MDSLESNLDRVLKNKNPRKKILHVYLQHGAQYVTKKWEMPNAPLRQVIDLIRKDGLFIDEEETDWVPPHRVHRIWVENLLVSTIEKNSG